MLKILNDMPFKLLGLKQLDKKLMLIFASFHQYELKFANFGKNIKITCNKKDSFCMRVSGLNVNPNPALPPIVDQYIKKLRKGIIKQNICLYRLI
ncbi:hypothetical protein BHT95_16570 [Bacillus paralicheniformis]|nr:hypothetical protein BHT95_16570 [Bacillus paralicheniformis]